MRKWDTLSTGEKWMAVGDILRDLGTSLIWLGIVLLVSVPLLVAVFGTTGFIAVCVFVIFCVAFAYGAVKTER